MEAVDTLILARWIIPMEPDEHTVLTEHCVAIRDGRIVGVMPRAQAEQDLQAHSHVELPQHALIPGLINAHTHAAMSLLRGLADDLPLMEWLTEHIWPAERHFMSEDFVADGSRATIAELLRGGVTCFNDMYFFPDVTAQIAAEVGMRACVGLIVIDFPSAWAQDPEEYLSKGLALHDSYREHPLIRTAFAPHAPYTVSDGPLERIRVYADELDIPINIHLHETAQEVSESLEKTGLRPLARLDRLGLLTPNLLAVHMTQLLDEEIALLAARGVHVIHCPESNMKLASGFCPLAKLDAAGVNVALGTDGAASNNDQDMFSEMRSAALTAKAVAGDSSVIPAARVLRMATLNGARALGLEAELGSISPGKWADLTAVDLSGIDCQPVYNPISQLVYTATRHHVTDVWVAGRHLLSAGLLTRMDERQICRRMTAWAERIGPMAAGGD